MELSAYLGYCTGSKCSFIKKKITDCVIGVAKYPLIKNEEDEVRFFVVSSLKLLPLSN